MTREEWLLQAVDHVRPWYDECGRPLPEQIRVSVGWGKRPGKSIGICYSSGSSEDNVHQIFISPVLSEPIQVLATLVHELIHAADNCESGHTGEFRRVATELGLEGKMTATHPGEALTGRLADVEGKLGEYPHATLNPSKKGGKTQKTYMLKVLCEAGCGFFFRITQKMIDTHGLPNCTCGETLEVEVK